LEDNRVNGPEQCMTAIGPNPNDASDRQPAATPISDFLFRELPYSAVLILTLLGVAYTSFAQHPIVAYWELLTPLVGLACILSGWPHAHERKSRLRLIWTQVLHWAAFLAAMNLLLLPSVQNLLNSNATGLAIMLLLALGTFVAGVHILSWEICVLGVIMALCVPAIAWIEESALIVLLGALAIFGVGAIVWWTFRRRRVA
jgi:hypothetical protein